ncbi:MAG TPA: riboflavin synthase [Candidatus Acetothermia bacterium]|nr:riboflavin synthase [Candidatus Acetothermia bacterium]
MSMFTGIVRDLGLLVELRRDRLEISTSLRDKLSLGASIAVNGVCLTVSELTQRGFRAEISSETFSRTSLGKQRLRARVNLELPLTLEAGLDGHIVLGHVDTVGKVQEVRREREGWKFVFSYPAEFRAYVVDKGSVAVDGISLTPFAATNGTFQVAVIPQTYEQTALQDRQVGDPVNIEFDILAKYVEGMVTYVH